MRRYTIITMLVSILIMGFASYALAIPDFDNPEGPPPREDHEKIRERIETLRMWRLTKALDLDEATASRLFPLLNRYDKKRYRIEKAVRKDMRDLKRALDSRRMDELQEILQRIEDRHRELQRLNDEERAELKRILTPEQQARYLLFQYRFKRELREMIEKARRRHLRPLPPEPRD
jgi:Spy/CpxP family protein refolding chaperone